MIKENLSMKVLVYLNSFGGFEALFISSCGSPGFDTEGHEMYALSQGITPSKLGLVFEGVMGL